MRFRLAIRYLWAHWRFALLFVLNLSLGLAGTFTIDAFRGAFQESMRRQSKLLLGADLVVSSRRRLTAEEEKILAQTVGPSRESKLIDLFSMLKSKKGSRLADVQAIDREYPFYGGLTLEDGRVFRGGVDRPLEKEPSIWLSPELAIQLGVKKDDILTLGEAKFRVDGIVVEDTSQSWKGFSLAPSAWIGLNHLPGTGLVREGANLHFERFYKFDLEEQILRSQNELLDRLTDPGIRIASHEKASEQVSRVLDQVNDYLALVSLVALVLAALGAAYLFRRLISQQILEMGVLQVLGFQRSDLLKIHAYQALVLGGISSVFALGAATIAQPFLIEILREVLAVELQVAVDPASVATGLFLGACSSLLLCLPLLSRLLRLRPSELFQESANPALLPGGAKAWPWVLPGVAFFFLAFQQTRSWKVSSLFVLALAVTALILTFVGNLSLKGGESLAARLPFEGKVGLRALSRAKLSTLAAFVSLTLGAILINLVPQIRANLERELTAPTESPLPSLFLFDIQDEQVDGLRDFLREARISMDQLSPMVRARLTKVNGKPFERDEREFRPRTREEARDARSRNRAFNLSYRDNLAPSESIVSGRNFSGRVAEGQIPEVTLEERFADRMGLGLGDRVEFDVLGIPVEGRVIGLRRVNWLSFQPNFFITFQPGALEDAPQVWLASLPALSLDRKIELQDRLVERFPNVSIVDVENAVSKTSRLFTRISGAITGMAVFCLVTGFAVLFSMALHRATERLWELNLLKILGTSTASLTRILVGEMLILSALSAAWGVILGTIFARVLVRRAFDLPWEMDLKISVLATLLLVAASAVLGWIACFRLIRQRPIVLLRE